MKVKLWKKWVRSHTFFDNSFKTNTIAFLEKKNFFLTGSQDSNIKLWDITSHRQVSVLKGHKSSVNKIIIDRKSGNMISGGEDMNILSWNLEYQKISRSFRGHISSISCLNIHPILNLLVSGSRDNTVRIWDLRMKKEALIIKHHKNEICSVLFNHESPHLISSSKDSRVCLWDIIAFRCINCLVLGSEKVRAIKPHPIELKFGSLCSNTLNLWRLDGFRVKKYKTLEKVNLFCFKNLAEYVTVDYLGWIRFHKWKYSENLFDFDYKLFPFTKKLSLPTKIKFNFDYTKFIISNNNGELGIFRNKWSVQ